MSSEKHTNTRELRTSILKKCLSQNNTNIYDPNPSKGSNEETEEGLVVPFFLNRL